MGAGQSHLEYAMRTTGGVSVENGSADVGAKPSAARHASTVCKSIHTIEKKRVGTQDVRVYCNEHEVENVHKS